MREKVIGQVKNGIYEITVPVPDIPGQKPWAKGVPSYDFGKSDGVFSGGDGSFIVSVDGTNADEYARYTEKLKAAGYRSFSEHRIRDNIFGIYENGENYVTVYYIACLNSVRVIGEPYYEYTYKTEQKKLVNPAVIASSVCDRNFYVLLPDNTLVVIDGGWRIEDWSLYDHYELLKKMYLEMSEILGTEKIKISLWLITHFHTDHARVLENLHKTDLKDNFIIDRILYNFPAPEHVSNSLQEASDEQLAEMRSNIEKWHAGAGKEFPYDRLFYNCPFRVYDIARYDMICRESFAKYGAVQIKAHDGMRFDLAGVVFEVLHTPDDDMPMIFEAINDTSLVVRMTYEGSSTLWLGDMTGVPSTSCAKMYGDILHCDCLQVAHHGWGAATPEFYELASPKVLLWNNSEFGFKYADRRQGYGKTKNSTDLYNMDCVKRNIFCNKIKVSYAELPIETREKPVFRDGESVLALSAVSDRTFYLKLPDGKLAVIDPGFRFEDYDAYDHSALINGLYGEMRELTGTDSVTVAALIISDAYPHNLRFIEFLNSAECKDKIKIERIIYSADFAKAKEKYFRFDLKPYLEEIRKNLTKTGAELIIPDGYMKKEFSGAVFEVLSAPGKEQYETIADTSLVVRFTIDGKSVIFTGDMTDSQSRELIKKYGDALKCDAVSVANHGWNNCGVPEFYKLCGAKLQLFANSEYGYQFFRKDEGYKKSKNSTEVYLLDSCKLNVFCNECKMQKFSFPLKDDELIKDN